MFIYCNFEVICHRDLYLMFLEMATNFPEIGEPHGKLGSFMLPLLRNIEYHLKIYPHFLILNSSMSFNKELIQFSQKMENLIYKIQAFFSQAQDSC